jgi:hypothetical protein
MTTANPPFGRLFRRAESRGYETHRHIGALRGHCLRRGIHIDALQFLQITIVVVRTLDGK